MDSAKEEIDEESVIDICQRKAHLLRGHKPAGQKRSKSRDSRLFSAGVAHDLNNLLAVILGNCELLAREQNLSPALRTMVTEIYEAGGCARDITQRIMTFSQGKALSPTELHLNSVILANQTILKRMAGDHVEVEMNLDAVLGMICANRVELEQVLINLVVNAGEAMPQGGKLLIETANGANGAGPYVTLTVRDEGLGLDAQTQARIFEPGFTTKAPGPHRGLGLASVAALVKRRQGEIAVRSIPGQGTEVEIRFPCFEHRTTKVASPGTGRGTILLVEDALPLRTLMRRMLIESGYAVVDTGDPVEALRLAKQIAEKLSLVITDLVMPGRGGLELSRKLSLLRPETKVLCISGLGPAAIAADRIPPYDVAFLTKPFTREDLLARVEELIGACNPLSDDPAQEHMVH